MNITNRSVEMLIVGMIAILGGLIGVYKARIAYMQHTLIPFKGSSMSPLQAGMASMLCLTFGLGCVILWWRRRKQ